MFVEDPLLNSAIWFFSGAMIHKILNAALQLGRLEKTFRETVIYSLSLLKLSDTNLMSHHELKLKSLEERGVPADELEKIKDFDLSFLSLWRKNAIESILINCPEVFRRSLKFVNWNQAMRYLDKEFKKGPLK